MGRARQIASAENMDRILLDASAASTDVGEHLLEEDGFFINIRAEIRFFDKRTYKI